MDERIASSTRGIARRDAVRALTIVFLSITATGAALAAAPAATHRVVMKATSYAPAELTVRLGDSIVWVNKDFFPHTVTAADHFDSGSIDPGSSWKYTPKRRGEYAYTCIFHPNMKGVLKVE